MTPTTKRLSVSYRKNGNEFVEYMLVDNEGCLKAVGPAQWKKNPLPDTTTDYVAGEALKILARKIQSFSKRISWNQQVRDFTEQMTSNEKLQAFNDWLENN